MLLRNSISNTKKVFRKTFQSVKSFFTSGDYQKLPKSPRFNSCSTTSAMMSHSKNTHQKLDKFYEDFTHKWDLKQKEETTKKRYNYNKSDSTMTNHTSATTSNMVLLSTHDHPLKQENRSFMHVCETISPRRKEEIDDSYKMEMVCSGSYIVRGEKRSMDSNKKNILMAKKVRELEMIDASNMDHGLDIEEFLYYYSRLTCSTYLDIVDKFFFDMYAELFYQSASPNGIKYSNPKLN